MSRRFSRDEHDPVCGRLVSSQRQDEASDRLSLEKGSGDWYYSYSIEGSAQTKHFRSDREDPTKKGTRNDQENNAWYEKKTYSWDWKEADSRVPTKYEGSEKKNSWSASENCSWSTNNGEALDTDKNSSWDGSNTEWSAPATRWWSSGRKDAASHASDATKTSQWEANGGWGTTCDARQTWGFSAKDDRRACMKGTSEATEWDDDHDKSKHVWRSWSAGRRGTQGARPRRRGR